MKRLNETPTDEAIVAFLKQDILGRNESLADFIGLLNRIEGGFTFLVDDGWGQGKTVFVRQLCEVVRQLNDQLDDDYELEEILAKEPFRGVCIEEPLLPVYYNAWENDYWDDPLPSMALSIAASVNEEFVAKKNEGAGKSAAAALDAVLRPFNWDIAGRLREGFSSEDLLDAFKCRNELRETINAFVSEVLVERANKLLLVIDELDRCRPSFALRVLEEVKNLFESDNVVVVLSANTSELAHTVAGVYGPGFDGQQYLSRFFDIKVAMKRVASGSYLKKIGLAGTSAWLAPITYEMANALNTSLREANRLFAEMDRLRPQVEGNGRNDYLSVLVDVGVAPMLEVLKVVQSEDYATIAVNRDEDLLFHYFEMSPTAMELLDMCISNTFRSDGNAPLSTQEALAMRHTVLRDLLVLIFSDDGYSEEYRRASDRILSHIFGVYSLSYIKKLL